MGKEAVEKRFLTLRFLRFGQELPCQWLDALLSFLVSHVPPSSHLGWISPSCPHCPFSWVCTDKLQPCFSGEEGEGIHPNEDDFFKSDLAFRSSVCSCPQEKCSDDKMGV